jgi:hypothetical protein
MQSEKVQVKIFSKGTPDVPGYVPVFQRWIREHVLDELLIDVVDYSHVADGPEVTLIGHESDYVLDRAGGKLGLLYASKRTLNPNDGSFLGAIKRALRAAVLLEKESGPKPPFAFGSDKIVVRIADRLNAPNSDATFERVAPSLRESLTRVYGTTPFTLARVGSPRDLFGVEIGSPGAPALGEMLARLD